MKVSLPKNYKNYYTIAELEQAKRVISAEKDDLEIAKDLAKSAAVVLASRYNDYVEEVLKAEAVTQKSNNMEYDQFCEGSGFFDVWIDFTAQTLDGFIVGGAYLSDIWNISSDDDRTYNMYCRYYTRNYERGTR